MGFNMDEVSQKQNRLIANMAEQSRKTYDMFYSPTPADVHLPQYDETGHLSTMTIPNRAKIKAQMWDDVGAAIGQFDRVFYVDAVNGDDSGPGTRHAPFSTIKKAVSSTPTGAYLNVIIRHGQTHDIDESIWLDGRVVNIEIDDKSIDDETQYPTIRFRQYTDATLTDKTTIHCIGVDNGGKLRVNKVRIEIPADSSNKPYVSWLYQCSPFILSGGINIYFDNCVIKKADTAAENHQIVLVSRYHNMPSVYLLYTDVSLGNHGVVTYTRSGSPLAYFEAECTFDDSSNSRKVLGLIRDTNGVPRNVISNIVL